MKTTSIKKVLIALDYDPTAEKVAEFGYSLASNVGAEIIIMHVVSLRATYSSLGHITVMGFAGHTEIDPNTDSNIVLNKVAHNFLEKAKQHLNDTTIKTFIADGDTAEAIVRTSKDINADIIVLGSHSKRWLENIIIGSVAEEVLHLSKIPVYIIPTKKN
ncbi:MAG: universal stress protein [Bacteroidota bacterium]